MVNGDGGNGNVHIDKASRSPDLDRLGSLGSLNLTKLICT